PDETLIPTGLGEIGSSWGHWERLAGLRQLADRPPTVDAYLHHPAQTPRLSQPVVWTASSRQPPAPRISDSDGRALSLQGVSVQARLQGARARTVVELIFHNPHDLAVDGTFELPLPDGASPSWLTLFPGQGTESVRGPLPPRPPPRPDFALPTPEQLIAR